MAMTPEQKVKLRARLDELQRWLSDEDAGASKLWNIICALRGPDDEDTLNDNRKAGEPYDDRKDRLTIPIRVAAFPKLAERVDNGDSYIGSRFDTGYELAYPAEAYDHFNLHAKWAIEALLELREPVKAEEPVDPNEPF